MCTRQDVREEIREELKKALPGGFTKLLVAGIFSVLIGISGWFVIYTIKLGNDMNTLLSRAEEQHKLAQDVTSALNEIHLLKIWQAKHDQYKVDKEKEFIDRFISMNRLIESTNDLLKTLAQNMWTRQNAEQRAQFVDYRFSTWANELEGRFEQCSRRVEFLELQNER